jgi:hypothetical protein
MAAADLPGQELLGVVKPISGDEHGLLFQSYEGRLAQVVRVTGNVLEGVGESRSRVSSKS